MAVSSTVGSRASINQPIAAPYQNSLSIGVVFAFKPRMVATAVEVAIGKLYAIAGKNENFLHLYRKMQTVRFLGFARWPAICSDLRASKEE
jgi:hypothetical protein